MAQRDPNPRCARRAIHALTYELEEQGETVKLTVIHEMERPDSKLIEAVSSGWPHDPGKPQEPPRNGRIARSNPPLAGRALKQDRDFPQASEIYLTRPSVRCVELLENERCQLGRSRRHDQPRGENRAESLLISTKRLFSRGAKFDLTRPSVRRHPRRRTALCGQAEFPFFLFAFFPAADDGRFFAGAGWLMTVASSSARRCLRRTGRPQVRPSRRS